MQLLHYNVGGLYGLHYDSANTDVVNDVHYRIATWINYLSDVEAGGATVFPLLNVTVWPEKGAALFWYNLRSSGSLDEDTLHSGCPVIYGDKWIATKWILLKGQGDGNKCCLDRNVRNNFP